MTGITLALIIFTNYATSSCQSRAHYSPKIGSISPHLVSCPPHSLSFLERQGDPGDREEVVTPGGLGGAGGGPGRDPATSGTNPVGGCIERGKSAFSLCSSSSPYNGTFVGACLCSVYWCREGLFRVVLVLRLEANTMSLSSQVSDRDALEYESKDGVTKWSDEDAKCLMSICQEYHKQNGVDTHFSWSEIAVKLSKELKSPFTSVQAKNKFDYMKKTWKLWTKLRMNETGLGWNPAVGAISWTDEWWDRKIKEDKQLKRFRTYQPDAELSEMWDTVFGSIVANGKHCVSAQNVSQLRGSQQTQLTSPPASRTMEELLSMNDDLDEGELLRDLEGQQEIVNLDTETQQAELVLTDPAAPVAPEGSTKRLKKGPGGAAYLQGRLNKCESSTERFLTLWEGEVNSNNNNVAPADSAPKLDAAIDVIYRMVNDGKVKPGSDMFCFAVDELCKESNRRLFMTLKTDDDRKAWIRFKFGQGEHSQDSE